MPEVKATVISAIDYLTPNETWSLLQVTQQIHDKMGRLDFNGDFPDYFGSPEDAILLLREVSLVAAQNLSKIDLLDFVQVEKAFWEYRRQVAAGEIESYV